jgi:apolipoprotein N-acyltransferase
LADIIGFQGLSTVTLVLNGLVLWTWWLWREQRRWALAAASVVTSLVVLNLWGAWHGQTAGKSDAILKFLVVQSNISGRDKISVSAVINRFSSLTQQGLNVFGAADFIVWPEIAFPAVIDTPTLSGTYPVQLKNVIISNQTPLITGGFSRLPSNGKYTNSLFVIGSNGEWLTQPYHKTVLLAFGEYTPMEDWFPALHRWIPEMGDLARGPGPTVLDTGKVKLGAQICYEGLLDWFSRALANRGAQILINITNDSWFGDWEEPFQHGFQTLARAVEVRLPLVRGTNTGLSTVMLAGGELMTLSPMSQPWFHLYEVPYATKPKATIFMTWGYWLFPAALMIGLFLILLGGRRKRDLDWG